MESAGEQEPPRAARGAEAGESGAARPRRRPLTPDLELREIRKGTKPGSRYVRVVRRRDRPFERVETGVYRATEAAIKPRSGLEQGWRLVKRVLVGAPLATSQAIQERLDKLRALPVFASDNLSSSAYATEEILLVLVLAGTGAFYLSIPLAMAISALVLIVVTSYTQTVRAYPGGGGAYIVAKDNLGTLPGLVAGASLLVDYVLTVAVSVAAGVAAMTSAVPELRDLRIELAVGAVALITLANLRGIRESGTIFAVPAYFFILSMTGLIVTGFVRLALGEDITPDRPGDLVEPGTQTITIFLILRAFSSGSAALTGIEAVSNGVQAFKPPEARNAAITLFWMGGFLSFFFLGLTILGHQMDIGPSESKTVVAQVANGVFGETPLFYMVQAATAIILILAANTSFADFPRLSSVMARDRFMPRQFSFRGDRLAFSHGIIVLGLASIGLLIAFQAKTHALIPLYAVGVFVGFTLSQAGMVRHWWNERTATARVSLIMNAVGATATGVVAIIIASTKFINGAWLTIGAITLLVFFLVRIQSHYRRVSEQLEIVEGLVERPTGILPAERARERAVILPVDEVNQAVLRTLEFARSISDNVTAVHVTDEPEEAEVVRHQWEDIVPDTPLIIIESPYRSFLAPMLTYIDAIDRADPEATITVVLPEFVPAHFWEGVLHNQSAVRLKKALLHRPNTVLIDVPYHLRP